MPSYNLRDLADLMTTLEAHGVPRIPEVDRALELGNVLGSTIRYAQPAGRLLDLDANGLAEQFRDIILRHEPGPVGNALMVLASGLAAEAADVIKADMGAIVAALRPAYDKAAAAVCSAVAAGIRPGMTAEDVIGFGDNAIAQWRDLAAHTQTLSALAALRVRLSETFQVAPWQSRAVERLNGRADHTTAFVDLASGVRTGWTDGGRNVWLGLAIATGGRLRLNAPDEIEAALAGDGESPGWIVAAHGAVFYDDERRAVQLYERDWVPEWVDADQITNALSHGLLVAAHADAIRPADKTPLSAQAG